jgi:hypothetical protein
MAEADDDTIHCERHGPARAAFVCQHLVHGSGLRFRHSDNGPFPDAWCSDCDALMMRTGHWTAEAERVAGIKIVSQRFIERIPQEILAGFPLDRDEAIQVVGFQHGLQLLGLEPLGSLDDRFGVG